METLRTSAIHREHIIRTIISVGIGVLLLWYCLYQARNLLAGPSITITDTGPAIHHERTVIVSGVAKNIVSLTRNGKPLFTDETGNFSDTIVLENGYTIVTFNAQDRYGRTTSLTRTFVFQPML